MEDKVAVVTGAAQGIGKSIATALLSEGYTVYLFDIDGCVGETTEKELRQRFEGDKVNFIKCDVTINEQFADRFSEVVNNHGCISVMVNNAGIVDEHNHEKCIAVNLTAVIQGCNMAIKHMRKDDGGKGGTIINVASMAAVEPHHSLPSYSATKSGVLNFTKSWAVRPNIEEIGLKFMCLCPGLVDTKLVSQGAPKPLDPQAFQTAKEKLGLLKLDIIENALLRLLKDGVNGSALEVSTFRTGYLIGTMPHK